jgi:integrase
MSLAATSNRKRFDRDAIERIVSPDKLSALTGERISHFVKVLRSEETQVEKEVTTRDTDGREQVEIHRTTVFVARAESTVKGILATLKAALNWARRQKMLHDLPSIEMPKRAKGGKLMKGRPVTGEEFERMLAAVPAVVMEGEADVWRWYLRGLWFSGLRLEESLVLYWDAEDGLSVDLSGRRPMLRIPAEHEKGNQDRLLPMAPEFAEMLLAVPQADRTGLVFRLPFTRKDSVSKVVSEIGTKAGVKVDSKRTADPEAPKVKYASAHDLRRSFGERWAARVMPQILMQLMRHESIETTMRYYVGRNAETAADVLWSAFASQRSSNSLSASEPENAGTLSS